MGVAISLRSAAGSIGRVRYILLVPVGVQLKKLFVDFLYRTIKHGYRTSRSDLNLPLRHNHSIPFDRSIKPECLVRRCDVSTAGHTAVSYTHARQKASHEKGDVLKLHSKDKEES
jgi:hypothetical protein